MKARAKVEASKLKKELATNELKRQQQDLIDRIKRHENLCVKIDDTGEDIKREKQRVQREQKYLGELEEREQKLSREYVGLLEQMSSGSSERITVKDLDERVQALES